MGSVGTYLSIPNFFAFFSLLLLFRSAGGPGLPHFCVDFFLSRFLIQRRKREQEGADEQLYEAPKATKSDSSNTRLPVAEKVNCT